MMREKPFYEATTMLEKSINMNKIMDMIGKLHSSSQFTSKQEDKNLKIAVANRSQLRQTRPYDGNLGLRAESDNEESEYNQKAAGRALFKVKQDDKSARAKKEQDDGQAKSTNGMLQNEEIKEICEKHALTRGEVYQIRSQFVSMCELSKLFVEQ